MLDRINIDMNRLTEWINTHHEKSPGKYDEIVDFAICTSHPSFPDNQGMIFYTGYNNETGIGQDCTARLVDVSGFIAYTGFELVA